jgi:hypothetical protein
MHARCYHAAQCLTWRQEVYALGLLQLAIRYQCVALEREGAPITGRDSGVEAYLGLNHGVDYLACIPTRKQRDLRRYAQDRESMVCNKGYRFSVTLLIPHGSAQEVSLRFVCHAPPCGPHRRRSSMLEREGS